MTTETTSNITQYHFSSEKDGNPLGGNSYGIGFAIGWQNGPTKQENGEFERNGAFVEEVIEAAIGRLEFYQSSAYANDYNEAAASHLKSAIQLLLDRRKDRVSRGVYGMNAQ